MVKDVVSITQQNQKIHGADKQRRKVIFKEDDWVLQKFSKTRLSVTTSKEKKVRPTGFQNYYEKLAKRYYGPFQVLKPINELPDELRIPSTWLIHNAFHASLLKSYKGELPANPIIEEPPKFEGQGEILQPESILYNMKRSF